MAAVPLRRPRRVVLVLAPVGLLVGCGVNGTTADVRVVAPTTVVRTDDDPAADAAAAASDPVVPADEVADAAGDPEVLVPVGEGADPVFPRVVGVIGDSLTVSAHDEIRERLERIGVRALVDARESRRMIVRTTDLPSGLEAVEAVLDEATPDLWVVALGTNDAGVGVERFRDDLRSLLASIAPDTPLVWVDIWIRDRQPHVADLNSVLREELAKRTGPTAVVDWFSHGDDDGVITGDGVHLTDLGQREFADAILARVLALSGF